MLIKTVRGADRWCERGALSGVLLIQHSYRGQAAVREWLNDLQMSEESNAVRQFSYRGLRLFADFPVQLQTDEAKPCRADARCVDISEEGMAVCSVVPLAIGARVVLRATFPQSNEPVTLFARVVNCHNEVYGLRFIFSSQGEKGAVSEFLATLNNGALPIRRSP